MTHRRSERVVRETWLVALLALLLLQCNRSSTDLLVVVYSDFPAGTGTNTINRIRVNTCPYDVADAASPESFCPPMTGSEFGVAAVENPEAGAFALPLSFVVRPRDARPNPRTFVEVTALQGNTEVAQHRVIVPYLPGQRGIIRVYLRRGCEPCAGATQTSCTNENLTVCVDPRVVTPSPFSAANPRGSEFDGGADVVTADAPPTIDAPPMDAMDAMDATAPTDEPVVDAPPPIDVPLAMDADAAPLDAPLVDAASDLPPDETAETPCVACVLQPRQVWPPSGAVIRDLNPRVQWTVAGGLPSQVVLVTALNRDFTAGITTRTLPGTATDAELPVEPGRSVFWRVDAVNGDSTSFPSRAAWVINVAAGATAGDSAIPRLQGTPFDMNGDSRGDVAITLKGDPSDARRNRDGILLDTIAVFVGGSVGGTSPTMQSQLLQVPAATAQRQIRGSISAAGDLNGDGFGDLAVSGNDGVLVYLGSPTGLATLPSMIVNTAAPTLVTALAAAGDLDHDGYADLVVSTDSTAAPVSVYRGGADAISTATGRVFALRYSSTGAPIDALLGNLDLNGDGYSDVVARNTTEGGTTTLLTVWLSRGGPLNELVTATTAPLAVDVNRGFARLNPDGDERDEVAFFGTGSSGASQVRLLRVVSGSSALTADSTPVLSRGLGAYFAGIATGDANNDGTDDVVGADSESNLLTARFGGSTGEMAGPTAYSPCSTMSSIAIAPRFSTAGTPRIIAVCRRSTDMTDVLVAGSATGNTLNAGMGLVTLTVMNMGSSRELAPPIVY